MSKTAEKIFEDKGSAEFQAMFDKAQNEHPDKMEFSPDESQKFRKAFDDPEFRKLFSQYMDDLQDPNHRAETETYISQLEKEDKVPNGKELVRPDPVFVAKTKKVVSDGMGDKIFMNIVQSDKISPPTSTKSAEGTNWSLPYSLGPPHMEKDKNDSNATCFDCCFHPEAIKLGQNHKKFNELLIQTAMDGVEMAYKNQKQDVKLVREFHILKGVLYKDGQVPSMMIDVVAKKDAWSGGKDKATTTSNSSSSTISKADSIPTSVESLKAAAEKGMLNRASAPPPLTPPQSKELKSNNTTHNTKEASPIPSPIPSSTGKPAVKKGFLNNKEKDFSNNLIQELTPGKLVKPSPAAKAALAKQQILAEKLKEPKEASLLTPVRSKTIIKNNIPRNNNDNSSNASTLSDDDTLSLVSEESNLDTIDNSKLPKYTLKERGSISMGDFERLKSSVTSNRPAELVYRFEVPLVSKPSLLNLDVAEKSLKLSYEDKYELHIVLPYPVFDKKGSAKYEKGNKCLLVTLPVQPAVIEQIEREIIETIPITHKENEHDYSSSVSSPTSSISDITPPKINQKNSKSPFLSNDNTEERDKSLLLKKEIQEQAALAKENARLELLNNPVATTSSPVKKDSNNLSYNKIVNDNKQSDKQNKKFIASSTFAGYKAGYCFKNGDDGIGYYIDLKQKQPDLPISPTITLEAKSENAKDLNNKKTKNQNDENASSINTVETMLKECEISDLKEFVFDVRQTKQAVVLLIQISEIIASSVVVSLTSSSVDVRFKSIQNDVTEHYGMGFDVNGVIKVSACKYDVVVQNMVIVLVKEEERIWEGSETSSDIDSEEGEFEILTVRKYVHKDEKNINTDEIKQTNNLNKDKVDNGYLKSIKEMAFSSNALFELD